MGTGLADTAKREDSPYGWTSICDGVWVIYLAYEFYDCDTSIARQAGRAGMDGGLGWMSRPCRLL